MDVEVEHGQYADPFGGTRSLAARSRQGPHQMESERERISGGNCVAAESDNAAMAAEPFVCQHTVMSTTYRRNGTPVGTPVHIAVDRTVPSYAFGTRHGM
jgi:hypothetical protein